MRPPRRRPVLVLAAVLALAGGISAGADAPHPPAKAAVALPPAEALRRFTVAPGLALDQVLSEPVVRKPVSISFDERGRMWVVQYLQYPSPAGLKVLSHDQFWRVVYDKVPAPPPHHVRGLDKVTIHEGTTGTGVFDKETTFVDGLNIATAAVRGRGGVWVLNPPYLLFYPTAGNADRPTSDPVVHLEGFGLEDTHSVVNSLRWGPDGWLYAAQGSTVTGHVKRPGRDEKPVHTFGQLIWRYHPETRRYEVFAEGGGNAFGVEFDARGRVFSGHNGGNTRGFHYVQGGYYRKGFEKHGALSNPYTFGFFEAMKHNNAPRFSHTFAFGEVDGLPAAYRGKLFAVSPLEGKVIVSDVARDGSSLRTRDVATAVSSTDRWFRPVDIKLGPDDALYVADWYDAEVSHLEGRAGKVTPSTGRVYRLRDKDARPLAPFDLGKKTTAELIGVLSHENKWFRQTALRLLGDRKDRAAVPLLEKLLNESKGQTALEALWALNLSGGFTEANALAALGHPEPAVREWAVRLLGDERRVTPSVARRLADLAREEGDVDVRVQLACSARRLPAADELPVVRGLLAHDEDAGDPHQPLSLWWAVEAKCDTDRDRVLDLFRERELWARRVARETVLPRLMRRFAQAGTGADYAACVALFRAAPDRAGGLRLLKGFEEAFAGRSVAGVPKDLLEETAKLGGGSLMLGLRRGDPKAVEKALATVADPKAPTAERLSCVEVLGEVPQQRAVPVLLAVVRGREATGLRKAALTSLQRYDDRQVGAAVVALYSGLPDEVRDAALSLLASRKAWAGQLLEAVESGTVDKDAVPADTLRKVLLLRDDRLTALVRKHWGEVKGATTEDMRRQIDRLTRVVEGGTGSPYTGKKLFGKTCAACHTLHSQGGNVGPDLTTYKRDDVATMLLHVVNPSAEIREGYENHVVTTESGRVVTGLLVEKDKDKVVLRGADGQKVVIARADVAEMAVSPSSLMPEGLLKDLNDQQVRDLFAYLRSTQPLRD